MAPPQPVSQDGSAVAASLERSEQALLFPSRELRVRDVQAHFSALISSYQ